jgi:hypothetical protein
LKKCLAKKPPVVVDVLVVLVFALAALMPFIVLWGSLPGEPEVPMSEVQASLR